MRLEDRFEIFTAGLCGLRSHRTDHNWQRNHNRPQRPPGRLLDGLHMSSSFRNENNNIFFQSNYSISTISIMFIVFLLKILEKQNRPERPVEQFWPWRLDDASPKKWHDGMKEWEPLPWFFPLWHLFFDAVLVVAKKTHPEKDVVWIFARLLEPSFHCTDDALEVIRPAPRHKMSDLSSALPSLSLSLPRWLPKKPGILRIPSIINYDLLIEILLQRSQSIKSIMENWHRNREETPVKSIIKKETTSSTSKEPELS